MKKLTVLGAVLIFVLSSFTMGDSSQGIKFYQGTWQEALREAKSKDKLIFVDCYTTWCGPCKAMSKRVFTKEDVGTYFNDNFINLKLDMEKGEGKSFAKKYKIRAYPTMLFIDKSGKVVHEVVGYHKARPLLREAKAASSKK